MKKVFLMLLLAFAGMSALTAQRTITGMITDDKGEALIGATILVEGTTTGTVTDLDGKFSLQVPEGNNTLLITYTGFASQEIALGAQTSLDIVLKTDVIGLEDVIVVGYAPQRRKDITGSVSSVSGSAIADVPALGVQTALNGRTSGVQVVSNSGTPGGGIDVRVRGSTSLNAS
ncbi:MAG TPA: carboxypeptidase-like regulatory domain-containing protein, partial [Flavilitoribacter sp.]|nr:carboxypeptidase-like regulatory domain-containing protein [Flavilitoribacter sp.]